MLEELGECRKLFGEGDNRFTRAAGEAVAGTVPDSGEHPQRLRVFAKWIRNTHEEVTEGNRHEYESEYRLRTEDWLPDKLREFRMRIYPPFELLIETLPETSSTRIRAYQTWLSGIAILTDGQKLQIEPSVRRTVA